MSESAFGVEHPEAIAKANLGLRRISGMKSTGLPAPGKNAVAAKPKWNQANNTWNRGFTQNLDRAKMSSKPRKAKKAFGNAAGAAQQRLGR